jgi:superfamily II DNA or RNA helicase
MAEHRIEVTNTTSYLYGPRISSLFSPLRDKLAYKVQNCEFMDAYNQFDMVTGKRKWDGMARLCTKQKTRLSFPTGLYSMVVGILNEHEVDFQTNDGREKFKRHFDYQITDTLDLRWYQKDAVDKMLKCQRGIVKAATGAGKTIIATSFFGRLGFERMVFMAMSGDLIFQAKDEMERFLLLNGEKVEVGVIGAGVCDIRDINVCTVQTACRAFDVKYTRGEEDGSKEKPTEEVMAKKEDIRHFLEDCQAIVFDEVQHAACDTVKEIMQHCAVAQYRLGLSASPWRDDGADLLIDSCFGKRLVDIDASTLIKDKWLVPVEIVFVKINTDFDKYLTYASVYKRHIVENERRNRYIAKKAIEESGNGRSTLILVKQIAHGKVLEEMVPDAVFVSGTTSIKKRKKILDEFRDGTIKILIATSIFDEGIDVKRVSCLILAGSGKSSTRALQRIGRVLRTFEGKADAIVYDFMDTAQYVCAHARARKKIYKTEKEFKLTEVLMED